MTATKREFHPVADLFPMLADDELAELAEDIKQRGLLQPIVLDPEGRVLDGRNRLAACKRAGVKPEFVTYEGDDPAGYALAVNISRRHLSKGQKAMVIALADLDNSYQDQSSVVSRQYVSWATTVRDFAPDLAKVVADGVTPLQGAYEMALGRKKAAEEARAKLDRLRLGAPDLVAHVDEERVALDDAIAALDAREEKARQEEERRRTEEELRALEAAAHAKRVSESLRMAVNTLTKAFGSEELRQRVAESYVSPEVASEVDEDIGAAELKAAAEICRDLVRRWGKS